MTTADVTHPRRALRRNRLPLGGSLLGGLGPLTGGLGARGGPVLTGTVPVATGGGGGTGEAGGGSLPVGTGLLDTGLDGGGALILNAGELLLLDLLLGLGLRVAVCSICQLTFLSGEGFGL